MVNRVTTLFALDSKGIDTGLKSLRTKIAETDGTFAKLKVGASGVFDVIKANAGAAALGVAGVAVAVSTKAVMAFEEGALAAGKFSDASGLATQDASRWQEVASDMGVSADTVATSFVRLEKAIGANSPAVKTLGLEVQRTKDGQVDANATMLEAIRRLGGVKDANEKALLASQLFGRGFADSAQLLLGNADDIKKRLDSVSNARVFDPAEVEKARKLRDAFAELHDSIEAIALTLGQTLAPAVTGVAEDLTTLVRLTQTLSGWLDKLGPSSGKAKDAFDRIKDAAEGTINPLKRLVSIQDDWAKGTASLTGTSEAHAKSLEQMGRAGRLAKVASEDQAAAFVKEAQASSDADRALFRQGEITDDVKSRTIELTAAEQAALDALTGYTNGVIGAGAAEEAHRQHVDETREALFRQGEITATVKDGNAALAASEDAAAAAADRHRQVVEALAAAEERRIGVLNESLGGEIAVSQAQRDARDALWKYNEQIKESNDAAPEFKLNEDQKRDLVEKTAQAQIAAAQAAAQYRIEQAKAAGGTVSAADEHRILVEELYKVIGSLSGPVRTSVTAALTAFNPPTTHTVETSGGLPHFASGGIVPGPSGRAQLVVAHGGEEVRTPAQQRGGDGGVTLIIEAGAIVLNGTAIKPQDIVDGLAVYVRGNGASGIKRLLRIAS